jgi:hypothetical protein
MGNIKKKVNNMAWILIPQTTNWEYSDTPSVDDPYNAHNYIKMPGLVDGIRTNSDGTQIYVYCRRTDRTKGRGYGEINKTALEG